MCTVQSYAQTALAHTIPLFALPQAIPCFPQPALAANNHPCNTLPMNTKSYLPNIIAGATGAVMAGALPFFLNTTQADTKLLPFQGRLTDAAGTAIGDGAKVVEFKMYDAPTGGKVVWAGEVHKLSVNSGLVNTLLGSKAKFDRVDFSTPIYLQITIDANGDSEINAADPPLLPRQSVVPAVFAMEAVNARKLKSGNGESYDWTVLFGSQSPVSGTFGGERIASNSIKTTHLVDGSIVGAKIADQSISASHLTVDYAAGMNPPGTILAYAGDEIPSGYLLCDASVKNKSELPELYKAIKTSWGKGNGSDGSFNLPDCRGLFLRGVAHGVPADPDKASRVSPSNLQGNVKDAVGSYQADAMQGHRHYMIQPGGPGAWPGAYNSIMANNNGVSNSTGQTGEPISDGIAGIPRVSLENRPKNVYV
ncbi:MAG: tail fiber protein, partial [Cytophagaceae bacterium]